MCQRKKTITKKWHRGIKSISWVHHPSASLEVVARYLDPQQVTKNAVGEVVVQILRFIDFEGYRITLLEQQTEHENPSVDVDYVSVNYYGNRHRNS